MIRYDLNCEDGHEFDSWFPNSSAYDEQAKKGVVSCPKCGSNKISKRLMTPGVPAKSNRKLSPALEGKKTKAVREAMTKLRQHIEATSDYVGTNFPEEARRIYYKESKERGIYGEASLEEAKSLREEGIEVIPLPTAPQDKN
jgi:hypothetical protein